MPQNFTLGTLRRGGRVPLRGVVWRPDCPDLNVSRLEYLTVIRVAKLVRSIALHRQKRHVKAFIFE